MLNGLLGVTIKSLRLKRGMSQPVLAGLCDLDQTFISRIELGKNSVSVANLVKIAAALDMPAWKLLQKATEALRTE